MKRVPTLIVALFLLCACAGDSQPSRPPTPAPTPSNPAQPPAPQAATPSKQYEFKRRDIMSKTAPINEALLRSLGYVTGTIDPNAQRSGVIVNDPKKAQPGYNLYCSTDRKEALLIDMQGRVVHRWAFDISPWNHVELLPNGEIIVVVQDQGLFSIDKDSKPLWKHLDPFHHDVWVDRSSGHVFAMYRKETKRRELHPTLSTLDEGIVEMDARGSTLTRFSLLDVLRDSPYAFLLPSIAHLMPQKEGGALDVVHANHVEVLDGSLATRGAIYKRGNLLVSMRNLSAVAILDGTTHQVVWLWGPNNLQYQHDSVLLPNGHMLIFNNRTDASQVIELDPLTRRIVWRYAAPDFFSAARGSNQRLANGNTLITESDKGYVFEVTPRGEIVWEFANPDVDPDGRRHAIWRMQRFAPQDLPFLQSAPHPAPQPAAAP